MNLIICSDGTWNTPDMEEQGVPTPTNVWRMYNAIAPQDGNGQEQKKYYHPGVGTEGTRIERLLGGGTGKGLDEHVMSAYRWLAGQYKTGDNIYLFGFSRGAYTVRSLGGMISKCGLLDLTHATNQDEIWSCVRKIFDAYRATDPSPILASADMPFNNCKSGDHPAKTTAIHFIGVWDTVGSLGIPDDMAIANLFDQADKFRFHDTTLSTIVAHARHAVAIDEQRQTFLPTLWQENDESDLKQVWFPGVHGDVGGGYAQTGLSNGALIWMIDEAADTGLFFREDARKQIWSDERDVLHDSVTGIFARLKTRPRPLPLIDHLAPSDSVHASAYARQHNPPLSQGAYRPRTLIPASIDIFARQQWNATGLFLEKGKTYALNAKGQWLDASIKCGPAGTNDGKFQAAELVQMVFSAVGKLEKLIQRLLKNEQKDFFGTKREEDMPWFCLVGVIANNHPPPKRSDKSHAVGKLPHEVFEIGDGVTITPKADGYLYCFANDAWQTYGNNRGSVRLSVEEI